MNGAAVFAERIAGVAAACCGAGGAAGGLQ